MAGTGRAGFGGSPPKVEVVERMLISGVPSSERVAFLAYLGGSASNNRSGETVFNKKEYEAWKKL